MSKSKKRWKSETEILNAIEACYQRSAVALAEAETEQSEASRLIREAHEIEAEDSHQAYCKRDDAGYRIAQVKKLRRQAARLIDKTAKKLGEKLSQFRTELMQFAGDDRSIPR